jgi:DNA modification methylase
MAEDYRGMTNYHTNRENFKDYEVKNSLYEIGVKTTCTSEHSLGRWPANLIHDGSDEVVRLFPTTTSGARKAGSYEGPTGSESIGDHGVFESKAIDSSSGSAARFFYCAKASKKDREDGNNHPTVKPTDIMRYLCRLVTPPGGVVLDPFMGSGSTGKAAMLEGFKFIGCELSPEYLKIAKSRIESVDDAEEIEDSTEVNSDSDNDQPDSLFTFEK